eukprot:7385550-Prymnesium_polylepis.3
MDTCIFLAIMRIGHPPRVAYSSYESLGARRFDGFQATYLFAPEPSGPPEAEQGCGWSPVQRAHGGIV